jgi:hypothetical protein
MLERTRKVDVLLFDDSLGLPVEYALVWHVSDVVTRSNDNDLVKNLIFQHAEVLKQVLVQHNTLRIETRDDDLYVRTGAAVFLKPVQLSDLRFSVV